MTDNSQTDDALDLTNRDTVKTLIRDHDYRVSKGLGQNFLCDRGVLNDIITAADLKGESALEIGSGLGVLTKAAAKDAAMVYSVEIARHILPLLNQTTKDLKNVKIINADFLHLDPAELPDEEYVVIGNLPYAITTPVLFRFLDGEFRWKRMVVMMQSEVADRIQAAPGTKVYGGLSVSAQARSTIEHVRRVPRTSFWPMPKVSSTVLAFTPRVISPPDALRGLLQQAFSARRKTLRNGLKKTPFGLDALESAGVDPARRPEELSVDEWVSVAKEWTKIAGIPFPSPQSEV